MDSEVLVAFASNNAEHRDGVRKKQEVAGFINVDRVFGKNKLSSSCRRAMIGDQYCLNDNV